MKNKGLRKLNLGCGNNMYGTDRLDFKKTKAVTKIYDIEKPLPYKDNTFDEVRIHAVFEHLRNCGNCVDEIYRVLKVGGKVSLRTDNAGYIIFHVKTDHNAYLYVKRYYKHPNDFHRQLFVPSHLKAYFSKFKNVEISYLMINKKGWKKWLLRLLPENLRSEALVLSAVK